MDNQGVARQFRGSPFFLAEQKLPFLYGSFSCESGTGDSFGESRRRLVSLGSVGEGLLFFRHEQKVFLTREGQRSNKRADAVQHRTALL